MVRRFTSRPPPSFVLGVMLGFGSSIVAVRGGLASASSASGRTRYVAHHGCRLLSASLARQMLTRIGPFTASPISSTVAARCAGENSEPAVRQRCEITNLARVRVCRALERNCSALSDAASQGGAAGARSGRETGQMNHHPDGTVGRVVSMALPIFTWHPQGPASQLFESVDITGPNCGHPSRQARFMTDPGRNR